MSNNIKYRRINFCEADFRSRNKIIDLYKHNCKHGEVTPDAEDFTQFFDELLVNGSGINTIHTDFGTHSVRMYTELYVAYEPSSMAKPGSFLGFCAIQKKFELTLHTRHKTPPYELEIPWFIVAKVKGWSVADIADTMLRALLAERAHQPYVSAVWAYDFGTRPQGAWWPACLQRAGFVPFEKDLQRFEPENCSNYSVIGYKNTL